jgi:hypothetical protein
VHAAIGDAVVAEVEVGHDAPPLGGRVVGLGRAGGEPSLPRQLGLQDRAELAHDVEAGLQARTVLLEERRRVADLEVGLLGRHPHVAGGERLIGREPPALDQVPAQQRVGHGPPHARGGVSLVGDTVPVTAQVDVLRQRRRLEAGLLGAVVVLGLERPPRGRDGF